MLKNKSFNFLVSAGLVSLTTACGAPTLQTTQSKGYAYGAPVSVGSQISVPTPAITSTPNLSYGSTQPTNLVPAYTSDFKIYGARQLASVGGPSSVTLANIQADNILKVVISTSSPGVSSGNGYQAQFDCVKFSVKVGNSTQTAFLTTTNRDGIGVCQGARSKVTLDFSSQLTAGHGAMTVEISDPYFDNCYNNNSFPNGTGFPFYNQGYATGYSYYGPYTFMYVCNMNQVPSYLAISGTFAVHTNGTL
jgi:hypothetical protein